MDVPSKIQLCALTATLAVGCACITFAILKLKYRLREATRVFNYIRIENISTKSSCDRVINELRMRCKIHRALGFDCEWVTEHGKRHPVALVQLSSYDGLCGIFRLNQLDGIPESLKLLLEDEKIYKVGVAPGDDARYLHNDYDVSLHSSLDIRHITKLCGYSPGGLAALAKIHLQAIMDKSWRVRCSDWDSPNLSDRQLKYAAIDAHVAIKIFVKLLDELNRTYKNMFKWLWTNNNNNVWSNIDDICWKYADVTFKSKKTSTNEPSPKYKTVKDASSLNKSYPNLTRAKPLYHNCFMEAPDGELLCTCDNKKALWYVEKKLADIVKAEPLTVRLRFEPAGRSVGDVGRYYQLTKQNQCVVCGLTNSYIRKNVVPREYRKYLPEIIKEHSSHDVVLLCTRCHQRSNIHDQTMRAQLAITCDAPISSGTYSKFTDDVVAKKVRSAANALLYQTKKHSLPEGRRQELQQILTDHYQCMDITDELLKEAAVTPTAVENSEYESHGLKVVDHFKSSEGGLLRLEKMWREHFLNTMRPKYMPELWSLKHNEERMRVRWQEGRLTTEEVKLLGLA